MAVEINIKGFQKKIAAMKEMAVREAVNLVNDLTEAGETSAKAFVPVDSGELKASIHMTPATIESGIVSGSWGTDNDHAVFVEYGTGQRGASGEVKNAQPKDPDESVAYRHDWPGMAARPYMYPASQIVAEQMKKRVGELGKKIMEAK